MQQRRDVVAAQRFSVAQLGRLQADGLRPRAVTVIAQELLPIGLKRRSGQVRREVIDLDITQHERILNQDRAACRRCIALLCIVCGTQSALVNCFSASGCVYSTTGMASISIGFWRDVGDLDVANFALLADRDEDRHFACGCRRTRTRCACSPVPRGTRSDRTDRASARRTARRRDTSPSRPCGRGVRGEGLHAHIQRLAIKGRGRKLRDVLGDAVQRRICAQINAPPV